MDPTANLAEQLRLAARILRRTDIGDPVDIDDVAGLAELVIALSVWIESGGSLPSPWERCE